MFSWFFIFLKVLHYCLHIWSSSHLLQSLLTALANASKLTFLFSDRVLNFLTGNVDFHKGYFVQVLLSKTLFLRCSHTMAKRARAVSHATPGSTARTVVYMPSTWFMGRQDSSQVLWHMVLNPTASIKAFLSMNRCQLLLLGWEDMNEGHLIQPWCCHLILVNLNIKTT